MCDKLGFVARAFPFLPLWQASKSPEPDAELDGEPLTDEDRKRHFPLSPIDFVRFHVKRVGG